MRFNNDFMFMQIARASDLHLANVHFIFNIVEKIVSLNSNQSVLFDSFCS